MIGWLAWLSAGAAPPSEPAPVALDALSPVARIFWSEAVALEGEGRAAEAAARYRAVRVVDPAFGPAVLGLARAQAAAGDVDGAVATLGERPFDPDAAEELGALLFAAGRHAEAADAWGRLVAVRPEWPGARVLHARALARVDPERAAEALEAYLGFAGAEPVEDGLVPVAVDVVEALRAAGRQERAAAVAERVVAADPASSGLLGDLLVRIEVELEAEALSRAADTPLSPAARGALRDARAAAARGELDAARRALEVLVLDAPTSAEAWGALSEVREAQGDAPGAELACRVAMRLDPRSAAWPARLGDLLSRWFAGRYDAEAAAAYARALRRRPDDPELWFRRGEAERRAGRWQAGVAAMQRVLQLDPRGPRAEDAERVVRGAALTRAAEPAPPAAPARPASLPEVARRAFHRAVAWRERDEPWALDEALAALAEVRRDAPAFAPAVALEAEIHAARGALPLAEAGWRAVLALEPDDAEARARLAALLERRGALAEAEAEWAQAAERGHPSALLRRARAEAAAHRWWAARRTLAAFFATAPTGEPLAAARALDRDLAGRIGGAAAGVGAVGVGLVALPLLVRRHRRGGVDLDALVERSPAVWRPLAASLAAIRHEVVKHHFGMLDAVADALDAGDPAPARFAAERWYGPAGALERLDRDVAAIESLGRAAGVRVNLRHRDARFVPLLRAADALRRLEPPLRSGAGRGLADRLRSLSGPLGRDAHAALGVLVDRLCVLSVDGDLLRAVHARAAAEHPGRAIPPPDLDAAGGPWRVRMFRSDLEDVLVNLVRNAFAATPLDGDPTVGLRVATEIDPVTFEEAVVITVADRAPGALSTRDLRGRHVSRGLGLAADLVARAGGGLSVVAVPGYRKGVAVRLPRVEGGGAG